jgi:H+-transporting ATPase
LFATCEGTQILGTLAAVYGFFVAPIGWTYALLVWGYALTVFLVESAIKIIAIQLIEHQAGHQTRHLERIGAHLHGA